MLPGDMKSHFLQHAGLLKACKSISKWQQLWFATTWSLWLHRNEIAFNGSRLDFGKVFDFVRIRAWQWCVNSAGETHFSFTSWCNNPMSCLEYGDGG